MIIEAVLGRDTPAMELNDAGWKDTALPYECLIRANLVSIYDRKAKRYKVLKNRATGVTGFVTPSDYDTLREYHR